MGRAETLARLRDRVLPALVGLGGVILFGVDLVKLSALNGHGVLLKAAVVERRDPKESDILYRFDLNGRSISGVESYGMLERWLTQVPQEGSSIEVLYLPERPDWNAPKDVARIQMLIYSLWLAVSFFVTIEALNGRLSLPWTKPARPD